MNGLSELAEAVKNREGHLYEAELKTRVTAYVVKARRVGVSWTKLSESLGIAVGTIQRWAEVSGDRQGGLARVRVVSNSGAVSVVSPEGWRIEGIEAGQALAFVRGLSR